MTAMSVFFDTLKYTEALERTGVDPQAAKAQARALAEALSSTDVATQGDVQRLEGKIELLAEKVQGLESRLVVKITGLVVVIQTLLVAFLLR